MPLLLTMGLVTGDQVTGGVKLVAEASVQPVAHAGESDLAALHTHAILDFEMAGLHAYAHTKTVYREHAAFADGRLAGIWGLR